jgi:hypothetical protein
MDTIGITKMEATDTGLGAMQVIHLNLARKYSLQWYYNIIEALKSFEQLPPQSYLKVLQRTHHRE